MNKMEEAEKKFEQYREHLKKETTRLTRYIHLYKHLHEKKRDRLDEMNIARCFFTTVFDALFSIIIIWVNNLIDPKAERGFLNFLTFIENNREIFDVSRLKERRGYSDGHWMLDREPITFESIQSDRKRIAGISSLPSFKRRRDKFHAHFDKEYAFERHKISEDYPLKWSDLDEVLSVMRDILNNYSADYDGNLFSLEPLNVNDIDYILEILHKHIITDMS